MIPSKAPKNIIQNITSKPLNAYIIFILLNNESCSVRDSWNPRYAHERRGHALLFKGKALETRLREGGFVQFTNRPFAPWRHFTTTTRILSVFPFNFKFGNPRIKGLNNKARNLHKKVKPWRILFKQPVNLRKPGESLQVHLFNTRSLISFSANYIFNY